MIQNLYERDIILYTYAALCGLGILLRFIVNMVYKHLVKQSEDLSKAKNKMLRYIKMKFEACFRLRIGVNNVDSFVDKNVLKYRFCGLLLSTWENLCGQVLMLNLLIVPILAVLGVVYNCGQARILFLGVVGIASSAVLIIVDKSINLSNKKKMFRINLLDYLENFCKVRLEQEVTSPELVEQKRREFKQVIEVKKQNSSGAKSVHANEEVKDELNRRREARRNKEEERRLELIRREEELRKAEEARKEEEKRKLEERKQIAAKRREEERLKIEEERKALEERRAELKRKAQEMQYVNELKSQAQEIKQKSIPVPTPMPSPVLPPTVIKELNPAVDSEEYEIMQIGLEEIAAHQEKPDKTDIVKNQNVDNKTKTYSTSLQEEKLIEDVLKEFFS